MVLYSVIVIVTWVEHKGWDHGGVSLRAHGLWQLLPETVARLRARRCSASPLSPFPTVNVSPLAPFPTISPGVCPLCTAPSAQDVGDRTRDHTTQAGCDAQRRPGHHSNRERAEGMTFTLSRQLRTCDPSAYPPSLQKGRLGSRTPSPCAVVVPALHVACIPHRGGSTDSLVLEAALGLLLV